MGLISEQLNDKLNYLVGQSFALNRMLDRGMSLLSVRFKLINTANILHPKVAHIFPSSLFADGISDYQGSRDNETIYPETPIGNKEYEHPIDFFVDMLEEFISFEEKIQETVGNAFEEGDFTTKVFLESLLKNLVPFIALAQTMVDLFSTCKTPFENMMLDAQIEKYINL